MWSEKIIEVEMVGESQANIVWEWNVWDHLIQDINPSLSNYGVIADHPEMVDINYIGGDETSGNWLHMNAIDYNPMLDQIVVSSRLWSEIWVIDHSTTTGEGKTSSGGKYNKGGDLLYRYGNPQIYGQGDESERKLFGQHDIRWIPDSLSFGGMMMVFNNDYEEGVKSRIEIFQPPVQDDGSYYLESNNSYGPEEITWSYEQDGLHSDILSSAQMQPNGNVLICEGRTGHFIEVSVEGDILWDYINPVNRNGGPGIDGSDPRMNMTWRTIKYSLDYKAFEGKDLIANGPVEVRPADYDCRLFPNSTTAITDVDNKQKSLRLKASIIDDFLQIESRINKNIAIDIIDLFGNKIKNFSVTPGDNSYPISEIIVGTYFLVYSDDNILRSIPFVKI